MKYHIVVTNWGYLQTQHKIEMDKRDGMFGPPVMAVPPMQHMDSPMVTHLLRHKVIQLLVIPQLLIHNMAILGDVITTLLVDLQCQVR